MKHSLTLSACFAAVLGCAAVCAPPMPARAQASPHASAPKGPPPGDPLGPDLYAAIRYNRDGDVRSLLDKGAQTEARNWLGFTPLLWAAARGNENACAILIEHKADVNASSPYGAPLEFATIGGNPKVVKLLMDHGAQLSATRSDRITALMSAADTGNVPILQLLLQRKPDVNALDAAGSTALMHAARRGQVKAAQLLLDSGAAVNTKDNDGRTALMYAALNGYPEVVRQLVSASASVDERDRAGDTALVLAARGSGDASVAGLLLKAGANAAARDSHGRTSAEIALRRGYRSCALAIDPRASVSAPVGSLAQRARQAALLSLPLIESTTHNFTEHSGCVSCHHQGLGLLTTGTAKSLGFGIDSQLAASEQKLVLAGADANIADLRKLLPHPEMYKYFVAVDMNELSPEVGSTLTALDSHGAPRGEAVEALATLLARQQMADGAWGYGFDREPIQSSRFTMTAYAVRVLNAYAPASLDSERQERIGKALAWLVTTPAQTNEDRAFRLLGLKWAGAPPKEIEKAAADIRRTQRRDGGWAQFTGPTTAGAGFTRSDAYATGESLYALHVGGGMKPTDAAYQRGAKYLLDTQEDDGSWFVNKRAIPANNYFDTGFPHGESQFISYGATCWSTMALMFAAH
jgi:ankyrin repeat protein